MGELRESVRQAAEDLANTTWAVRKEACVVLSRAGQLAAPHLPTLMELSRKEKDYEVRKEAQKAVQALNAAGVTCEVREQEDDDVVNKAIKNLTAPKRKTRVERGVMKAPATIKLIKEPEKPEGPHATFVIYKEELPMRLEREAMTPYEVAQIWE